MNLDDPIETLNLTVRGFNVLKREGVNTLGDLLEAEDRLADMRNIGKALPEVIGHVGRIHAAMIDVSTRKASLTADGGVVHLAGVAVSLSPSDVDLGYVLVQIDTDKGTKLNVAINDGDVFRGDPEDPRNTFEVIQRAAMNFLHGDDEETVSLKDLADALGVRYEDVAGIEAEPDERTEEEAAEERRWSRGDDDD